MTASEGGVTCLLKTDFEAPITDRWFEDYRPGAVHQYGYLSVTEPEMLRFARQFDPQPIHVDPEWH